MYPVNFLGPGGALIFFCFFSSIKGRKEGTSGEEKKNPSTINPQNDV